MQIYLNRRKQIFLHLGHDELNKTHVQHFNDKYFEKESPTFAANQGRTAFNLSRTSTVHGQQEQEGGMIRSSHYGALKRDAPNMISCDSFNTEMTTMWHDDKRDTIH